MFLERQPNPPIWPNNVLLFHPEDDPKDMLKRIQMTEDDRYEYVDIDDPLRRKKWGYNSNRHFSHLRYALLFAPGRYDDDVLPSFEIGYYVHLAGLGVRANDVIFEKGGPFVEALNKQEIVGGRPGLSLDTFWRMAENFSMETSLLWAVSQAAPLRRVHIQSDLILHDKGAYASGGVLANAIVEGNIEFGSQQQYLARHVHFRHKNNNIQLGAWSNVFVGCIHPPPPSNGGGDSKQGPSVTIDSSPPVVVEKPFIALKEDDSTQFELHVPPPRIYTGEDDATASDDSTVGPDLTGENDERRDFSHVKVAIATVHSNEEIQQALDQGYDLVLSPGIYHLHQSLQVRHSNQVILGLGLATLVAPTDGSPCLQIAPHLEGVRIAGIMLEASELLLSSSPNNHHQTQIISCLLQWGQEHIDDDPGNRINPGTLHDIFVRVGGLTSSRKVSTDVMVRLHSGNIYGDNLWLWRADHLPLENGQKPNFPHISKHYYQTVNGDCPCQTGLEVTGHDITIHGLAVEHTTEHQVIWKGNRGNVQFYQSEFPYDANCQFASLGYRGYFLGDDVDHHTAGGVGIYSNFRDHYVPVHTAIEHPFHKPNIQFTNAFTKLLDNHGQINSIINGQGEPAKDQNDPPSRIHTTSNSHSNP